MCKRFGVTTCIACAALVVGLAATASPAVADGHGRGRQEKPSTSQQRSHVQQATKDHRGQQVRAKDPRGRDIRDSDRSRHVRPDDHRGRARSRRPVYVRPRLIRRFEPVRRLYISFPVWSHEPRVSYWHDRPFFFHASLGVFVAGGSIFLNIGSQPPPGYAYVDPYSGRVIRTIDDYRWHCALEHHEPLVQVVSIEARDGYWHAAYGAYEDIPLSIHVGFNN